MKLSIRAKERLRDIGYGIFVVTPLLLILCAIVWWPTQRNEHDELAEQADWQQDKGGMYTLNLDDWMCIRHHNNPPRCLPRRKVDVTIPQISQLPPAAKPKR